METYFKGNFNMCTYNDNIQYSQYTTNYNYDVNTCFPFDAIPAVCVAAPQHMTVGTMMRGTPVSTQVKNESESRIRQFHHSKSKRVRTAFNNIQIMALEHEFRTSPYITRASRLELAVRIQLPELQIKIWFQNRRMKAKKESNRVRRDSSHSTSSISDTNTSISPVMGNYSENSTQEEFYSCFPHDEPKQELDYYSDEYLIAENSSVSEVEKSKIQVVDSEDEHGDFTLYCNEGTTPDDSTAEDDFSKICGEELVEWILEKSSGHFSG